MKLTWFGETAFRLHAGGQVVVIDAGSAPDDVDRTELVSGADAMVRFDQDHPLADGAGWIGRPRQRLLDAGDILRPVEVWTLGAGSLLVDADEDAPLLVLKGGIPALGRWTDGAVIVLIGSALAARAGDILDAARPRLVALAGDEIEVSHAFDALRDRLDRTSLVALEPGLAVEV